MFTCRRTADVSVLSSYGSCKAKNKRCGSCILTTKLVTRTNYYDTMMQNSGQILYKIKVDAKRNWQNISLSLCLFASVFFSDASFSRVFFAIYQYCKQCKKTFIFFELYVKGK